MPDSEDPRDELRRILRSLIEEDVLPNLRRFQNEQIGAAIEPLQTAVNSLSPRFSADMQRFIDTFTEGLKTLEGRLRRLETGAGEVVTGQTVAAQEPQQPSETVGDRLGKLQVIGESLIDVFAEKIFPLIERFEGMRYQRQLTTMIGNPVALAQFREQNPYAAVMIAQQLVPDQTAVMVQQQLPIRLMDAMATGMKINLGARQAVVQPQGGAQWPGIPGSESLGRSSGLHGVPSGSPSASPQTSGVRMQGNGRRLPATKPESGLVPRLSDVLRLR